MLVIIQSCHVRGAARNAGIVHGGPAFQLTEQIDRLIVGQLGGNLVTINEQVVARNNNRTDWACTSGGSPLRPGRRSLTHMAQSSQVAKGSAGGSALSSSSTQRA